MKKILKDKKLYLLYFLVMAIIIFSIFLILGFYPFGNKTVVRSDLSIQYYPMLIEMYNRVHDGSSLIYSFNQGLGMPIIRNLSYYLLSPFNLIFIVIKNHILAINILIFAKIFTIGLTTLFYLKRKFKTDNILLLIPSICFALCGWVNAYFLNIMWLDSLILLPLITLGIESLIDNRKYKMYIISLSLAIITNYYMAYMLCIYSVIYFLAYNLYRKKDGKFVHVLNELSKNFNYFLICSILAGILSSVIILPSLNIISTMGEKSSAFKTRYTYTPVDYIASSIAYSNSTVIANDDQPQVPNVYVGLISIVLLIPFVLNKKIEKKSKMLYLILLGIFLLIMAISYLDYIMHAFHIPQGFPFRYSFMYSFILVIISSYELINIKESKLLHFIISTILISILLLVVFVFKTDKISDLRLLLNVLTLVIYLIILLMFNKNKIFKYILIIITMIEVILSFCLSIGYWFTIDELNEMKYKRNEKDYISKPSNDEFYRSESIFNGLSYSLIYDYYGVNNSSSMEYSSLYYFYNNLGSISDFQANNFYTSGSKLSELLFDIKYIHYDDKTRENDRALSLLYGIDQRQTRKLESSYGYIKNMNNIVKDLSGIEDLYIKNKYNKQEVLYEDDTYIVYKYTYPKNTSFTAKYNKVPFVITGQYRYALYDTEPAQKFNGNYYTFSLSAPSLMEIINNEAIVCFYKKYNNESNYITFTYDEKKFNKVYEYLNKYPFNITTFKEDYIEGTMKVDKKLSVMSSIPYDKGWHVYVDDKEVNTYTQYDTFLGFDLDEGEHNIKLKYKTPYILEGLIISLVTLISILVFDYFMKHKKNKA